MWGHHHLGLIPKFRCFFKWKASLRGNVKPYLVQLEEILVVGGVGGVGKQVILMLTQSSSAGARTELGNEHENKHE